MESSAINHRSILQELSWGSETNYAVNVTIVPEFDPQYHAKSWSDGSTCWVTSQLPSMLTKPYILEFGYQLPGEPSFSWNELVHCGDILLQHILTEAEDLNFLRRPIVFIAHGLGCYARSGRNQVGAVMGYARAFAMWFEQTIARLKPTITIPALIWQIYNIWVLLTPVRGLTSQGLLYLGTIREYQNRPAESLDLYLKALSQYHSTVGPYHFRVADIYHKIGVSYMKFNSLEEASHMFTRAIHIFGQRSEYAAHHVRTPFQLAQVYFLKQQAELAEETLKQANMGLKTLAKKYGKSASEADLNSLISNWSK